MPYDFCPAKARENAYVSTLSSAAGAIKAEEVYGYVWLMPGASLKLYVGGAKCVISGSGVVNGSERASSMAIYGLPACTTVTYSGSSAYIGTVYAPSAKFTLSGGSYACGAFLAKSFVMSGGMNVHCDEALYGGGGSRKVSDHVLE